MHATSYLPSPEYPARCATREEIPALDELRGLLVEFTHPQDDDEEYPMGLALARYYAARYREWKEQNRAEGRAEGLALGRLVGAVEARLRRPLTDEELARLDRRIARDGHDVVRQRALALDDADLARWVAGKRVRAS